MSKATLFAVILVGVLAWGVKAKKIDELKVSVTVPICIPQEVKKKEATK